ncbi:hypothetical protein PTV_187 [Candidatus Portiera aleyrodidarum]|uniref:Uncharacterized protein n=1 Tax=Candidatus Portiera aleyrodidarum TV TaxID=1297582 RepID=A0A8D3X7K1_9GAMM|nr:hypothetical protein [Candidatus Portiera aleyrodidarum]AGI27172.1 hypothetical protein PalTV_187 [Candidatus Portiera aleyrodidarum TV]CEI59150.1 hypothetical protein PTV_187 [Candidatus Portiera aleyrodidarum]
MNGFDCGQKKEFPINKLKNKEIYFCNGIYKRNKHKINSMFVIQKINKLKKRIEYDHTSDIYIIQYKNIKKTLYKVDINKLIINFKKQYICKFKLVKKYIVLNIIC